MTSHVHIIDATMAPRMSPRDNYSIQVTLHDPMTGDVGETSAYGGNTRDASIQYATWATSLKVGAPVHLAIRKAQPACDADTAARQAQLLGSLHAAGLVGYVAVEPWDCCGRFVVVREGDDPLAAGDDDDDNLLSLQDATGHAADCNGMLWAAYRAMQPALDFAPAMAARRTFAAMAAHIDALIA